ncbi:kinase-like domain-containing protein [Thelephora terrestris]|uniref:Kinase-like domain-containing protein n=1 Tax=Thelephora terrestris TaxID=56493 RepID=A0A9P6HLE2_9AGAM|nr:kinase-like domain-containing protein [Thelephora terrestris]
MARGPEAQGRTPKSELGARRLKGFSQVVSRALAEIEPNEERRTALLEKITAAQADDESTGLEGAEALVETLDKLARNIQDRAVRDQCLRILSKICRAKVTLPESYIVSDVVPEKRWKIGGFADIWTGKVKGEDVCLRVFRQHEPQQQAKINGMFYSHAIRWKYLSHENVLPFLGISEALRPFGLVSPWMPNIDILEYIKDNPDAERLSLLANAACGLEYLHSENIVHGGINPGSILITGKNTACIGGFEIAGIITNPFITGQGGATTCRRGIVRYMAPEQVYPEKFGMQNSDAVEASDVYSFAMTVYEALTGTEPYAGTTGEGPLATSIVDNNRPPRPNDEVAAKWLPDPVWEILEACWIPQPTSRPLIKGVHQVLEASAVHADRPMSLVGESPLKADTPQTSLVDVIEPPAKRGFLDKIRGLVNGCHQAQFIEQ